MVFSGLGNQGRAAAAVLSVWQACHGFGIGFSNSHEMSYRQARTPDELQARTNTTMRSFNRAVIVVAAPLAGLLAVHAGTRPVLILAAATSLPLHCCSLPHHFDASADDASAAEPKFVNGPCQ